MNTTSEVDFKEDILQGIPSEIANNQEVIEAYLGNGAFHGH